MRPWFAFDRLDRYALRLIAGPLALALLALLLAQLLERLLRLFDLAASAGAQPAIVLVMAATLVPHYLGLALPMAFTAAIFMAAARMCDDNELDVMLVTGRSIARVTAPYFVLAVLLAMFSLYLYGQVQPLARYGYNVVVNRVLQTGWIPGSKRTGLSTSVRGSPSPPTRSTATAGACAGSSWSRATPTAKTS